MADRPDWSEEDEWAPTQPNKSDDVNQYSVKDGSEDQFFVPMSMDLERATPVPDHTAPPFMHDHRVLTNHFAGPTHSTNLNDSMDMSSSSIASEDRLPNDHPVLVPSPSTGLRKQYRSSDGFSSPPSSSFTFSRSGRHNYSFASSSASSSFMSPSSRNSSYNRLPQTPLEAETPDPEVNDLMNQSANQDESRYSTPASCRSPGMYHQSSSTSITPLIKGMNFTETPVTPQAQKKLKNESGGQSPVVHAGPFELPMSAMPDGIFKKELFPSQGKAADETATGSASTRGLFQTCLNNARHATPQVAGTVSTSVAVDVGVTAHGFSNTLDHSVDHHPVTHPPSIRPLARSNSNSSATSHSSSTSIQSTSSAFNVVQTNDGIMLDEQEPDDERKESELVPPFSFARGTGDSAASNSPDNSFSSLQPTNARELQTVFSSNVPFEVQLTLDEYFEELKRKYARIDPAAKGQLRPSWTCTYCNTYLCSDFKRHFNIDFNLFWCYCWRCFKGVRQQNNLAGHKCEYGARTHPCTKAGCLFRGSTNEELEQHECSRESFLAFKFAPVTLVSAAEAAANPEKYQYTEQPGDLAQAVKVAARFAKQLKKASSSSSKKKMSHESKPSSDVVQTSTNAADCRQQSKPNRENRKRSSAGELCIEKFQPLILAAATSNGSSSTSSSSTTLNAPPAPAASAAATTSISNGFTTLQTFPNVHLTPPATPNVRLSSDSSLPMLGQNVTSTNNQFDAENMLGEIINPVLPGLDFELDH